MPATDRVFTIAFSSRRSLAERSEFEAPLGEAADAAMVASPRRRPVPPPAAGLEYARPDLEPVRRRTLGGPA